MCTRGIVAFLQIALIMPSVMNIIGHKPAVDVDTMYRERLVFDVKEKLWSFTRLQNFDGYQIYQAKWSVWQTASHALYRGASCGAFKQRQRATNTVILGKDSKLWHFVIFTLLHSGDIEVNPGPVTQGPYQSNHMLLPNRSSYISKCYYCQHRALGRYFNCKSCENVLDICNECSVKEFLNSYRTINSENTIKCRNCADQVQKNGNSGLFIEPNGNVSVVSTKTRFKR